MDNQQCKKEIKPIGRDTVHKICSGQVVLSLGIAVKELVENAIDAGASIIDVSLKEYGSELIQVSDNGHGVLEENFQSLTLKHYTSKLRDFEDLRNIASLGFRGEALSSLCALTDLTVITRHETAQTATKLSYDKSGIIKTQSIIAREPGTTVVLKNLFSTLPVRRKEFLKNLKREFNKMCQLLYAYCLVSQGVKFSVTNATGKGAKNIIVKTEGSHSVTDNIMSVFGVKQLPSLIKVELMEMSVPFTFDFFISGGIHGSGRSSTDRQFCFVNSRPCELSKATKLINEIYRQYNPHQYPFVYLNVTSKSCLVDVNVTPDKRQVFIENEKILLDAIKSSLEKAFENFPCTFKLQNLDLSEGKGIKRSATEPSDGTKGLLEKFQKRSKTESDKSSTCLEGSFDDSFKVEEDSDEEVETGEKSVRRSTAKSSGLVLGKFVKNFKSCNRGPKLRFDKSSSDSDEPEESSKGDDKGSMGPDLCFSDSGSSQTSTDKRLDTFIEVAKRIVAKSRDSEEEEKVVICKPKRVEKIVTLSDDDATIIYTLDENAKVSLEQTRPMKSVKLEIDIETIRQSVTKREKKKTEEVRVNFRSKIIPKSNKTAEEELRRHICKENFKEMEVVGQFNKGFMVARLGRDLFIIDQHAADEKYNFELLQANTVLEKQVLVNPMPLELTAGNECLLIDNEEVFKRNGFTFRIDHSVPCTKRVSLTSIPISKSCVFGKDDIDEMLFMLKDSNDQMCRPSRVRSMFASRACRKSVMIGKALSRSDMRKLIDQMGEIEQPWNCPHGRPTMRHLINLDLIQKE